MITGENVATGNFAVPASGNFVLPAGSYKIVMTGLSSGYMNIRFEDTGFLKTGMRNDTVYEVELTEEKELFLQLVGNENTTACTINFLIQPSSIIATDYEPYHTPVTTNIYLDKPLYSTSDATVRDYIDFATGKRHDLITTTTLSAGTHTLSDAKSNGNYMCTQQVAGTLTGQVLTLGTGVSNAEVDYELATETTEDIDLPILPLYEGTNIISIDTEVQPSYQQYVYITKQA